MATQNQSSVFKELIPPNVRFDFLGMRWIAFCISGALIALAVHQWVTLGDAKYGIDFLGGHEIVIAAPEGTSSDAIRDSVEKAGLENAVVQSFEVSSNQYSIRLGGNSDEASSIRTRLVDGLKAGGIGDVEVLKTDFVGPTIGQELRRNGLIAVIAGLIGIMLYIAFRFEFAFGLGAVVALFHDVIVATGIYLATGNTISMATLAAALTIVGYSVNDTIVIFDRVREEVFNRKSYNLYDLINDSINITLSRTLVTHLLTLFSVVSLLVFGGGAIKELSIFLCAGVIAGSYSTIYIVAPVVLAWHKYRGGTLEVGHEAHA